MYCANCGSVVEERSKFCKMCGAPVNGNTDAAAAVSPVQPVPEAPVQTKAQAEATAQVKNKGVLPAPLYVVGLIFDIFNLLLGTGMFIVGIFAYAIEMATGSAGNAVIGFIGTLLYGFAAGGAFIAIIMGIINRSKPKNGVSSDKTRSYVTFIILTIVSCIMIIIGAYFIGTIME